MDNYLWQYVMRVDPFAKEEDIKEIRELNDWDILITYKDGRKIIFDSFTGYHRSVFYTNVKELSDKQEKQMFAYRLRCMMKRKFITQEQLAELIGTSQVMISRYMNGQTLPNVLIVRKIAKVLDCSMDDLFYQDYI